MKSFRYNANSIIVKLLLSLLLIAAVIPALTGCTIRDVDGPALDLTGMSIVFEDNFDGDSLDGSSWVGRRNGVRNGGYWDSTSAVSVKDGAMYITASYQTDGVYGAGYYSACVGTENIKEFTYGYFEVRCICPAATGLWSAFWLQSQDMATVTGDGSNGAEIDVMESPFFDDPIMPAKYKETTQHTIHIDGYGADHKSEHSDYFRVPGMYSEYHTYGVMWTANRYDFYIDGKQTYSTTFGVSNSPEFLLLSVEIAGKDANPDNKLNKVTWSGDVRDNPDGTLPAAFVVDYVKVYQET